MKCNYCQQIEATVLFTKVAGDEKQTLHLCPACAAKEAGQQKRESDPQKSPKPAAGQIGRASCRGRV